VRFIRANAAAYKINPDSVGAFGGSSGGHLVSMLGVLDGHGTPDDADPINRPCSKVQAVVAVTAPSDLGKIRTPDGAVAVALLIGGRPNSEGRRVADASPVSYVSKDDAPFLLIHGVRTPWFRSSSRRSWRRH
jgi:acetyl esterase/lipase